MGKLIEDIKTNINKYNSKFVETKEEGKKGFNINLETLREKVNNLLKKVLITQAEQEELNIGEKELSNYYIKSLYNIKINGKVREVYQYTITVAAARQQAEAEQRAKEAQRRAEAEQRAEEQRQRDAAEAEARQRAEAAKAEAAKAEKQRKKEAAELNQIMKGKEGILELSDDLPSDKEFDKLYLPNIENRNFGDKKREYYVSVFYYMFLNEGGKKYIVGWNYWTYVNFYDDKGCWWFKGHRGKTKKYNCRNTRLYTALSTIGDNPQNFDQEKLKTIKDYGKQELEAWITQKDNLSGLSGAE